MRKVVVPAVGKRAGQEAVQQSLALGLPLRPGVEVGLPPVVGVTTTVDELAGVGDHVGGDVEALVRVESEHLLGGGDLVGAQGAAPFLSKFTYYLAAGFMITSLVIVVMIVKARVWET